MVLEEQMRAI